MSSEGAEDPLSVAVSERDRFVLDMVRAALEADHVMLAFQPVIGAATGMPAFHEGLIRVLDETGRVIPAGQFMPVVERRELGREIDCAALRCGLDALAQTPTLRLAINMSARSIGYPRWTRTLRRGMARDATVGERLILEISEASAMQVPELVKSFMTDWQDKGITFALDDFGAGRTSFRDLKEFYFDLVKIDGSFVRDCDSDPDNQCLLEALIGLARSFDMFTVAEMVETRGEAEFLAGAGIDCLQGYYYGAPQTKPGWLPPPADAVDAGSS
ncbi:EAL domain-containing protein [Jannaschia ovalis]|uniref:EAL domain-containing protein n=1 Tax=Jannaschia ovalis TaxID=3038773 RepID=A0ABY8L899_9RHOB|nr:EAL domain-containing protein [Jannaschia sp. GRR-S6-38]WGH77591.1 EAL domain-containing protein [Jannaschia sp. GRR-S6-38]